MAAPERNVVFKDCGGNKLEVEYLGEYRVISHRIRITGSRKTVGQPREVMSMTEEFIVEQEEV